MTVASEADADRERRPGAPLPLGGDPAGAPGVRVDQRRPLTVPDQVAEVVPPAVVRGRGVAVPEVPVVSRQQHPHREQHRGRGGEHPDRLRPPGGPHDLTAARNTEEPNGRSRRASTRSSHRHRPRSAFPRTGPTSGTSTTSAGWWVRRAKPVTGPTDGPLGDEHRKDPGEAVGRTAYLEAGVLECGHRPRAGVAAVVAVRDVVVAPRPLVRRHRGEQAAAGLEDPVQLAQRVGLGLAVLDHVERADHLEARVGEGQGEHRTAHPVGRPEASGVEVERHLLRGRQPADAGPVGAADVEQARGVADVGAEGGPQHLRTGAVPPVVGLQDRRRSSVRCGRRVGHRGRVTAGDNAPMTALVLASASPARLATLRAAGVDPSVMVSGVDESVVIGLPAAELALRLAELKCDAVADGITDGSLVLGCDSVLDLDGEALGKPDDADDAVRRWRAMRGRSGVLRTGHCLRDTAAGTRAAATASTVVHFADVTDAEIAAYVATASRCRWRARSPSTGWAARS